MVVIVVKQMYMSFFFFNQFISTIAALHTLETAFHILEQQNNRKFDLLVILSDITHKDNEIDSFKEKVIDIALEENQYYYIFIYEYLNASHVIQKVEQISDFFGATLIVVFDFENSNLIKRVIFNISSKQFKQNTWLIINPYNCENKSDEISFLDYFPKLMSNRITFDTQLYILKGTSYSASLSEVFKSCDDEKISYEIVQEISIDKKVTNESTSLWGRRNDLMGCNLRVAYIDQPPYITKDKGTPKIQYTAQFGNETFYGGNINQLELIEMLSHDLNFTTTWIPTRDNAYGVYNRVTKNGMD